jgi:hypothetical protein
MSFRFRKRIKLFPSLGLNASKRGISARIGGHGLTANISKKGRALDRRASLKHGCFTFSKMDR